jgi:hypothetical protein
LQVPLTQGEEIRPLEKDCTLLDGCVLGKQAQQRQRERGLSAAQLAENADGLARGESETNATERGERASLTQVVTYRQFPHFKLCGFYCFETDPLPNDPAAGPAGLLAMGSHLK